MRTFLVLGASGIKSMAVSKEKMPPGLSPQPSVIFKQNHISLGFRLLPSLVP